MKLVRAIPLRYHQFDNGTWLDTMYDDALQYCFYELSGNDLIKYMPEITYLYKRNYGNNDDSTAEKVVHRRSTRDSVATYPRLSRIH